MTEAENRRESLWVRWSRLELVKRRTPSQAELASAIIEQTEIEDEIYALDAFMRSALQ